MAATFHSVADCLFKKIFPDIQFTQIDLEEELLNAVNTGRLPRAYLDIKDELFLKEDLPSKAETKKYENFLDGIVRIGELEKYDHYFFAVYNYQQPGLTTNFFWLFLCSMRLLLL